MGGVDKLLLPLAGKTVIERSVAAFSQHPLIAEIVVVTSDATLRQIEALCSGDPKVKAVVEGGKTRYLSVQKGVAQCDAATDYYAIHDAARPFVSAEQITNIVEAAFRYGAAAPGLPVSDTIKRVDDADFVAETLDRDRMVAMATPQVFAAKEYRQAAKGFSDLFDDCQIFEAAGLRVRIVPGQAENIKITVPADIVRARQIAGEAAVRIGQGYDVHRLVPNQKLTLGGVDIPFEKGLDGHSDADVLIHAIIDALLGAAALGDIGKSFPDSDAQYKGICSMRLLERSVARLAQAGYQPANIDATVVCQAPKLSGYTEKMVQNIATACGLDADCVSVKATTEEGLGFTGTGQGIAAMAVAAIKAK
jgi:2-C-methyl-D-erythritol 4-phosphate cytidylyltransferase/2-C-methyl-D-erythritol 2,4-cyclodiphosphate synthase